MASRLSDCLVRDGTVTTEVVRAATARQAVYGGTLDTALLELDAVDEPTLWSTLATATQMPIPDPALFENPDPAAATHFDLGWSRRCRAVPVGQRVGALQVCCSEPIAEAELAAARAALGLELELFVVPEVRLAAARQAVYGEPMPPRLLRVLARLLGAQPVRRWVHALTPSQAQRAPAPLASAAGTLPEESFRDLEGELAEAEFDVPANTFTTEPLDIIDSRPSRAADEVAKALSFGAPELGALEGAGAGTPVAAPHTGSGSFADDPKIDTSPGRAAALAGAEPVPRTTEDSGVAALPTAPPSAAGASSPAVAAPEASAPAASPPAPPSTAASSPAPPSTAASSPAPPSTAGSSPAPPSPAAPETVAAPLDVAPTAAAKPVVAAAVKRPATPTPLTDEQENQLCLVAEDLAAAARLAALRVLRARLDRPRVRALADKLGLELKGPAERAVPAAGALGELRDGHAVPALIDALQGPPALAQTAARALLEIAQQDFGQSRKKWLAWWETHKNSERVDWLLEGLSHKSPEIRFASSEELRLVTGEYFGYHFDLPKKEREEARERWQKWWRDEGRARTATRS